jgi:hypothetical protein
MMLDRKRSWQHIRWRLLLWLLLPAAAAAAVQTIKAPVQQTGRHTTYSGSWIDEATGAFVDMQYDATMVRPLVQAL